MSGVQDDSKDYWRGRYDESVTARKELDGLLSNSWTRYGHRRTTRARPPKGVAILSRVKWDAIFGAIPPLMMVLFGVYGTGTGADIGVPMIIIGVLFALLVIPYLLIKRNDRSKEKKSEG